MRLSIIIPTLNANAHLPGALKALAKDGDGIHEIIVADGGSTDGTAELARAAGARVVRGPAGRGSQLETGAHAAAGDWLLFLHADTRLDEGWRQAVTGFAEDPANAERAAYFRFALDDTHPAAKRLENLVAWRCRKFALPYGDQGLLIAREFYEAVGRYRDWPLMEDVEFVRRVGAGRLVGLPVAAVTSAQRYRRAGYLRQPLSNLLWLSLYFAGVSPRFLAKLYR